MNHSGQEQNRRILVIDDLRSIHDDFRKILGTAQAVTPTLAAMESALFAEAAQPALAPFEVSAASQGEEGVELVRQAVAEERPFAVAFVDMRMPPGWDGIETIEQLWQVDPDVQVVICTAHSDYMWQEILSRLGRTDRLLILKKPFDNVEVRQCATALAAKWQRAQETRAALAALEERIAAALRERDALAVRLQRSQDLLRLALAAAPQGAWIADAEGRCTLGNERWSALTGLTAEQSAGDGWMRAVHPDDLARVAAAWAWAGNDTAACELRLRRTERGVRRIVLRTTPVKGDDGRSQGALVTAEDITELSRAAG